MKPTLCALSGALLFLCASMGRAQSTENSIPEANPGRPTVSTPATLTPVGYLQFENGGLYATDSSEFDTRFGINQVTKLAVTSRLQLLALSEPLVHSRDGSDVENRPGEVFAGLQAVVVPGEGSNCRKLHTPPL